MDDYEMIRKLFDEWCEENGLSEAVSKGLEDINKYLNNLCEESDEFMTLLNEYASALQEQAYVAGFKDGYKMTKELK